MYSYNESVRFWVAVYSNGELKIDDWYGNEYIIPHLPEDKIYQVSLDPSTSTSGFAIKSLDGEFILIGDADNSLGPDNKNFKFSLVKTFIARCIADRQVRDFIREKPVPKEYSKDKQTRYTSEKLQQVAGIVDMFSTDIMDLWPSYKGAVYPSVWRKYADIEINNDDYKYSIARSIVNKYPMFEEFLRVYIDRNARRKDFDCFEALGIMTGFTEWAYDRSGNFKIHGDKNAFKQAMVYFDYVDLANVKSKPDLIRPLIDFVDKFDLNINIPYRGYQTRATFYDNAIVAASTYEILYTYPDQSIMNTLKFKSRWEAKPKHIVIMIVIDTKAKFFNKTFSDCMEKMYPINQLVVNDNKKKK